MPRTKNNELNLKKKIELIDFLGEGNSERKAALKFKVSKGTVSNMKKIPRNYWICIKLLKMKK